MKDLSRRTFLQLTAGATAVSLLSACGSVGSATSPTTLKIGYISPQTGPLSGFGETDAYILKGVRAAFAKGITTGGKTVQVDIIVKDSQSDQNRAASVASDLILKDQVDLMLVASTPETTNPVSDQCEANGVPCISSVAPWQAWYYRNPKVTATGYKWTYHFFFGIEDLSAVFADLWDQFPTNKIVGAMWPNDGDGNAASNVKTGMPPLLNARGYKVVDAGRYQDLTDDFTSQITLFKNAGVQILTGIMIPPDLATFMKQASQQGFKPRFVTVAKASLFPSAVQAIGGGLGDGLTNEIWWSPSHPFKSSLTGQNAQELADGYTQQTSKEWSQPLGFAHALFEVAADVIKRTQDIGDPNSIVTALKATNLNTMVGPVNWSNGPTPNVSKIPLVSGQWSKGTTFPYDLVITSDKEAPTIPLGGKTRLLTWSA
jgi:branched-chain amino acid transport system substrate-binding protein